MSIKTSLSMENSENLNSQSSNFYEALSSQEKEILHNSKVNFQGYSMKLSELVENNFEICASLSSSQIEKLLNEKKLKVGKKIQKKSQFSLRILRWKNNLSYRETESLIATRDPEFTINFNNVYLLINELKIERATALKQIAIDYKAKNPHDWISLVDLPVHRKIFEKIDDIKALLCRNKFEEKLFMAKYESKSTKIRIFWTEYRNEWFGLYEFLGKKCLSS